MSPTPAARLGAHPATVLGVHIEPLVRGRRVAILGDATLDLAEQLQSQRGARLVHAYDPDPARAAEALARSAAGRSGSGPRVHYAAFEGDLGVRDGAFDVVIIPDLSRFDDAADVLRRARRLVPTSGAVVVASPNLEVTSRLLGEARAPKGAPGRGALSYYELFDAVSLQFPVVRMIGQAPFVGYAIADFALAGEPSVNIDTSLLEATEQPEWFIAIGSERPVALDEFAVIELPLADINLTTGGAEAPEISPEDRLALIEARTRLAVLTTELESTRERQRAEAREAEAREKSATAMSARLVELEAELAAREVRLKESQTRAGDAHVRAERLTHQITDLEEELRRQRDRATKLTKQLDDEKKARTKADMELGMIRNKPEIAGAKDRLQELSAELEAARARIVELSAFAAPSQAPELSVVAPDVGLVSRVSELEIALQEARHRLAEASSKGAGLEERAASAEKQGEEKKDLIEALDRRVAELSSRNEELDRRVAELSTANNKFEVRVAELTRANKDLERRVAELSTASKSSERRVAELSTANEELKGRVAELSTANEELERRAGEAARATDEAAAALTPDLLAAEALLRERGQLIAKLQRDLRESERIGRELVDELTSLRDSLDASPSAPEVAHPPPTVVERDVVHELRARLNALAARGAKTEADLQAASWRVAQLERDLADAQTAPPEPSAIVAALEHALSAARDEIASLRGEAAARSASAG